MVSRRAVHPTQFEPIFSAAGHWVKVYKSCVHTKAHTQAVHTDFSHHHRPPACFREPNPRQLRLAGRQVGDVTATPIHHPMGRKNGGRRPGRIYHVIRGTGVTRIGPLQNWYDACCVLTYRACIYLAAVFQVHTQHGTCRSTRTAWLSYGWLDKVYECVSIM